VNYLAAVAVSLLMIALNGLPSLPCTSSFTTFFRELRGALSGGGGFSTEGSAFWALASGIPAGGFYYLGIITLQRSIRECGVSLTGSFSKMGVLVPMALSMVLWREIPAPVQWIGILLALAAILAGSVGSRTGEGDRPGLRPVLLLLFLAVGMAEFSNKVYQFYGASGLKNLFLLAVFVTALALSTVRVARRGIRLHRVSFLTGLAVGVPNYFASFFLIAALSRMSATVVFPVYGALTICLIALFGRLFFGERLKPRERLSVALAAVAMVLVNLKGSGG
jgi:multidrug transporter EmrE-like cation transporter